MKRLLPLVFALLLSFPALASKPIDQQALREHCDTWVLGLARSVYQQKLAGVPREVHYERAAKHLSGKELAAAKSLIDALYDEDVKKFEEGLKAMSQVCVDYNNRTNGPKA